MSEAQYLSATKAKRPTADFCYECGAWRGSLGLEPHPQMFIDHLVEICREIKRVLKPTGTFWLNLGDSYYGGHGQKHGIGDTKEQDLKVRGVLSQNPYDVRRDALSHNIFDTRHYLAAKQVHASSLKIRGCMRDLISHHSTEDCSHQTTPLQSSFSILGRLKDAIHESAPSLFFPSSTMRESSRQLLDHKMLDDNHQVSVFPSMLQTFYDDALVFVHKLDGALRRSCGTQDIVSLCEELVRRTLYISEYCLLVSSWVNPPNIKPQGTKKGWLQPKQKLMIPSRVAIALQDDGWVLRSDVIWHKPNHMPSSVQDRLTTAYEHIFLFVKARRYYFDLDAIRVPHSASTIQRITQPNVLNQPGGDKQRELRGDGGGNASRSADMVKSLARNYVKSGSKYLERSNAHTLRVKGGHTGDYTHPRGKNPGDLWRIPTTPFSGAHFACVSDDTEVLTKEGWRNIDTISLDDEVCTLHIIEETLHYHKPYGIYKYQYEDELILIENQWCSQLVTPNHRVLLKYVHSSVKKRLDDDWHYVRADKVRPYSGIRIPLSGTYSVERKGIGKALAAVIGWVITDGYYKGNAIIICQSLTKNPQKVDKIRSLLNESGIGFNEHLRVREYKGHSYKMVNFYIPVTEARKIRKWIDEEKRPKWELLHLPIDELEALYDAMIEADGNRREDGRESFVQTDDYRRDFFRVLCLHRNKRTTEYKATRKWGKRRSVSITQRNDCQIHQSDFKECVKSVPFKGRVWCPSLPNMNFVARRKGKIFITGNTFPPKLIEPIVKAGSPRGGIVLDPFGGSGTVGQVARKLGRRFILIEINPEYVKIAEQRVRGKYRAPSPGATTLI